MSTPPPANPYADPQAANPYADQVPAAPWAAPEPPKPHGKGRSIGIGLGVMVLAIGALFAISHFSSDAANAKAGDCVHNSGTAKNPDVAVVDCSDPQADFKVLETIDSSNMDDCQNVPDVEAAYTESAGSGDSILLCLGRNTN